MPLSGGGFGACRVTEVNAEAVMVYALEQRRKILNTVAEYAVDWWQCNGAACNSGSRQRLGPQWRADG
jgi:hypothetical protein